MNSYAVKEIQRFPGNLVGKHYSEDLILPKLVSKFREPNVDINHDKI